MAHFTSFAIELQTLRWRTVPPNSLARHQTMWLRRPGSLTRALRTLGEVAVTVVREGVLCGRRNAPQIDWLTSGPVWVRDVSLSIDGKDVIAARSITTAQHSRSYWKSLRTLGSRPLATILYHDRSVTRSGFFYAPFYVPRSPKTGKAPRDAAKQLSWGRASVFRRQDAPLIVTEVFLPALWVELSKESNASEFGRVGAV